METHKQEIIFEAGESGILSITRTDILGSCGQQRVLVYGQRYENRADEKKRDRND